MKAQNCGMNERQDQKNKAELVFRTPHKRKPIFEMNWIECSKRKKRKLRRKFLKERSREKSSRSCSKRKETQDSVARKKSQDQIIKEKTSTVPCLGTLTPSSRLFFHAFHWSSVSKQGFVFSGEKTLVCLVHRTILAG